MGERRVTFTHRYVCTLTYDLPHGSTADVPSDSMLHRRTDAGRWTFALCARDSCTARLVHDCD